MEFNYVRPQKACHLNNIYQNYIDRSGDINARFYNRISLVPLGSKEEERNNIHKPNWIVDDCNFVSEIIYDRNLKVDSIIKGKCMYAGFFQPHWGHFIGSSLSRLWYFIKNKEIIDKIIFATSPLFHESQITNNIKEVLDYLEISDKILYISTETFFEEIIIPDLSLSSGEYFTKEHNIVFDLIRKKALKKDINIKEFPERIFLTRSQLEKSKLAEIGIEMLDDTLRRNNFYIIYPEKISLTYLIHYFYNAKLVAGVAGSTIHNIIFGNYNQNLIIFERNVIYNLFQPGINLVREISCEYIDSFLTINSVNLSLGPFFYYSSDNFLQFLKDNNYKLPHPLFLETRYLEKNLKRYLKIWKKFYKYQWYFQEFSKDQLESFYESYQDSFKIVGNYLTGNSPLFLSDKLSLISFFKKNLNRENFIYKFIHNLYKKLY